MDTAQQNCCYLSTAFDQFSYHVTLTFDLWPFDLWVNACQQLL